MKHTIISGYFSAIPSVFFFTFLWICSINDAKAQAKSQEIEAYQAVFELIFRDRALAGQKLDSLLAKKDLTPEQRQSLFIVKGVYHGVGGELDTASHYLTRVIEESSDKNLRARAMHNLSIIYKERGDFERAGDLVRQALALFRELGNKEREAALYGEMAFLYQKLSFYDLALDYQLQAITILENMPEKYKNSLHIERQKLAELYVDMADYAFALGISEKSISFFKEIGDQLNTGLALTSYAFSLGKTGRTPEALLEIDNAITLLKKFEYPGFISFALIRKAEILREMGKSKAEVVAIYEEAIKPGSNDMDKYAIEIYSNYLSFLVDYRDWRRADLLLQEIEKAGLNQSGYLPFPIKYFEAKAKILHATGKFEASNNIWQHVVQLKDSLSNLRLSSVNLEMQEKYKSQILTGEVEIEKLRADALERAIRAQRLNLFLALLLAGLISLVAVQYVRKNRLKREQLQKLGEAQELLLKEQALVQEVMAQQKLVIEEQQQQLMANALEIANQNEKIEAILEKAGGKTNAELSKLLKGLKSSGQYWESLMLRFRHLNPHFMEALQARFPQLTQSEIEFCALVRLNLSFKDIGNLMQISHKSVFTKKYRIAQKMKVAEDEDFFQIIRDITL